MFKKYFSNLINKDTKERGVAFIPILIIGGIIAAVAAPAVFRTVSDVAAKTAIYIVSLVIAAVGGLAAMFFGLAVDFAQWIMAISMQIPITTASPDNWAYAVGWVFTRDLANVVFIIILAYAGLATILRIKDYEISSNSINRFLYKVFIF